jgi:hypothetical protein
MSNYFQPIDAIGRSKARFQDMSIPDDLISDKDIYMILKFIQKDLEKNGSQQCNIHKVVISYKLNLDNVVSKTQQISDTQHWFNRVFLKLAEQSRFITLIDQDVSAFCNEVRTRQCPAPDSWALTETGRQYIKDYELANNLK